MTVLMSTSAYSKNLKGYVIDLRAKQGSPIFAPSIELILEKLNQRIDLNRFIELYLEQLNFTVQEYPKQWLEMIRSRKCTVTSDYSYIRVIFAHFAQKMGARILVKEENVLSPDQLRVISDFEITKHEPAKPLARAMVVDPLTVNSVQSSICRMCRENRTASAWTPEEGQSFFQIVDKQHEDAQLNSRNIACCSTTVKQGQTEYLCPIFTQLLDGYRAGVTSQGANLNPCKNCNEHVDNGGSCFGDRCKDGPFYVESFSSK
jgi:hypothetical protein